MEEVDTLKFYDASDERISLHGLNQVDINKGQYWRTTAKLMEEMPQYDYVGKRSIGARIRFKTDAETIRIRYRLATESVDLAMGLPAASGIDIYLGKGLDAKFAGFVAPKTYGYKDQMIEGEIKKSNEMELVTINFPRNDILDFIEIGLDENAELLKADDYLFQEPIVFYGSSITEGGCAPRPGTAYTSIVTRWLDSDYFNYGFSGGAKGELAFAKYIAAHEKIKVFVMDYDHNAPDPEHLEKTHKPFFDAVRKAKPNLPIVLMTRPDFGRFPITDAKRRYIVYQTYIEALENGDENVYFVDGESFFGFHGREECTIDGCHPNALGFMRMAEVIYPLLRRILTKDPQ